MLLMYNNDAQFRCAKETSDASGTGASVRITLNIDDEPLNEVVESTGERSKRTAVSRALEEYVRRTKVDQLRARGVPKRGASMRTTLDIDDELLDKVVEATGERTKSGAVNAALKEYIRRKHVQELVDSWGKIIVDDYSEEALKLDEKRRAYLDSLRDGTA